MNDITLVTGATGTIGKEVVKELLGRKVCVRIGIRNPDREKELVTDGCPVVHLDYSKPETYKDAFEGIKRMFLAVPIRQPRSDELLIPVIDYAKKVGVEHIVSLGAPGIEQEDDTPLMIVERCLINCGINYTLLRPNLIMQNFGNFAGDSIRTQNVIRLSIGDAKVSYIDARDIAAAVAKGLLKPDYQNKTYKLTGKESISIQHIVSILSEITKRQIRYEPISHNEQHDYLLKRGWQPEAADLMVGLFEIARHGWCSNIYPDTSEILGREPHSFLKYAQDNRNLWT